MKVIGELEKAQVEQINTAGLAAITQPSRIIADVTTPTAIRLKYHDGTSLKTLSNDASSAVVVSNSGQSVIVDWSLGLNQQVILTNNCVISFSNPQAGQIHRLMVTQGQSSGLNPYFLFTFNMTNQDSRRLWYQPPGVQQANQNQVFTWFYNAASKPAYATIPNASFAPNTVPGAAPGASDISPDGKTICIPTSVSPFSGFYNIYYAGIKPAYGLKNMITPTTAVAALVAMCYAADGNFIFGASGTTPFLQGWFVDRNTASGAVLANPVTLPTGAGINIACHPAGGFVGIGHTTTPFMSIYPYSGAGYGTKLTNPVSLPAAQVNSLAWSKQGDYLAVASQTTPFLQVYAFSAATGAIGAVSGNPGTLPAGGPAASIGKGVAWRPQGDYIALAMTTTPFLYVVPFNRVSGAFGTALTITAQPGTVQSVQWTPDGQYLLVALAASPFLAIYDFSAFSVGTAINYDGSNPGQTVTDIIMSPGGDWAALVLTLTPFLTGITLPNKQRDYVKIYD